MAVWREGKVLPCIGARQGLLGQTVWGHWWERKPNLVPKLNFLSSCWGFALGSGPQCPQRFTNAAAWDFKNLQEGVFWQRNRARLFNLRRPYRLSRPSRKGEQQWRHLSTKSLSQRESGRRRQGINPVLLQCLIPGHHSGMKPHCPTAQWGALQTRRFHGSFSLRIKHSTSVQRSREEI